MKQRIWILWIVLLCSWNAAKGIHVQSTVCDTIYHINGDTLSVRIYKYNNEEVLYKFCDEYNRPVRKITAEFIYKIQISETGRVKKYNKSAREIERENKKKSKKRSKSQKIQRAIIMGVLVGGIIGSILSVILLSLLPANPYISLALTLATVFIVAFNTKVKEYRILTIISSIIAFGLGIFILNLFRSFL